jgi:hypothetical protein
MLFKKTTLLNRLFILALFALAACAPSSPGASTPSITPLGQTGTPTPSQTPAAGDHPLPSFTLTLPAPSATVQIATPLIDYDRIASLPQGYYILHVGTHWPETYALSLDGKTDVKIGNVLFENITVDGKTFLVSADRAICKIYHFTTKRSEDLPGGLNCVDEILKVSPNQKWLAVSELKSHNMLSVRSLKTGDTIFQFKFTGDGTYPLWSPDSKWLAFTYVQAPGSAANGLYLLNTLCLETPQTCEKETTGPYQPANGTLAITAGYSWSPDGQRIVMLVLGNGSKDNRIAFFDLVSRKFILASPPMDTLENLLWLPDNTAIAYTGGASDNSISINLFATQNNKSQPIKTEGENILGYLSTYAEPVFQVDAFLTLTGAGAHLRVRSAPGLSEPVLVELSPGDRLKILDGPVIKDGGKWWKVSIFDKNVTGYCLENKDWFVGQ